MQGFLFGFDFADADHAFLDGDGIGLGKVEGDVVVEAGLGQGDFGDDGVGVPQGVVAILHRFPIIRHLAEGDVVVEVVLCLLPPVAEGGLPQRVLVPLVPVGTAHRRGPVGHGDGVDQADADPDPVAGDKAFVWLDQLVGLKVVEPEPVEIIRLHIHDDGIAVEHGFEDLRDQSGQAAAEKDTGGALLLLVGKDRGAQQRHGGVDQGHDGADDWPDQRNGFDDEHDERDDGEGDSRGQGIADGGPG